MGARFRFLVVAVWGALGLTGSVRATEGLSVPTSESFWSRWQPRLELRDPAGTRLGLVAEPTQPLRAALLGDYDLGDFGLALPRTVGRFRATSGLLFGLRPTGGPSSLAQPWAGIDPAPPSAPYIGLGYTGWMSKTGLSFSADVGLTADYPGGTWRFGRALLGNQGADAALREIRLQPRLQLGMQYSY